MIANSVPKVAKNGENRWLKFGVVKTVTIGHFWPHFCFLCQISQVGQNCPQTRERQIPEIVTKHAAKFRCQFRIFLHTDFQKSPLIYKRICKNLQKTVVFWLFLTHN